MRLIDVDKFKEYIVDGFKQNKDLFTDEHRDFVKVITCGFLKDIDEQPTVDIDKVLKQFYTIIEELGDKLEHYETLEEQGRLLELPCAVGDTVHDIAGKEARKQIVDGIEYTANGFFIYANEDEWLGRLGDLVFLTKEEAEAKLKGLRGKTE